MKLAFIADIHSNLYGLDAVLEKIRSMNIDKIFCCGDLVGYYTEPAECIQRIKDNKIESVIGNHDLAVVQKKSSWFKDSAEQGIFYSIDHLNSEYIKFLEKLPYNKTFEVDGVSFYMCHGSPRDNLFEYIHPYISDEELKKMSKGVAADVIVTGHTHVMMEAEVDSQIFLNPGSVGQPRDGISKASFMIFETEDLSREWVRVDYDISALALQIHNNDLPPELANRLYNGK